jgi:DNA-3-methyladenine glycosylase
MPLMDTHVAILVPMPRITRQALPVDTVALARYLIGGHLVHVSARGRIAGRIVETEAYPPGDPTGYARPGLTTSNAPLFEARGTAYVRMVYGACLTLNLAAEPVGTGAAVLIRALEPIEGIELMLAHRPASRLRDLARGPGRVCAALGIGRDLSGVDLCTSRVLWLESAPGPRASVQVSTRIGLSRDQHRRLRFIERGSPFVSVPP